MSHRANRFGRVKDYHATAHESQLLTVQIECAEGVANAAEIAAVDGVDVLFIGPGDLSANLGSLNNPEATHVQAAIREVITAARASGKNIGPGSHAVRKSPPGPKTQTGNARSRRRLRSRRALLPTTARCSRPLPAIVGDCFISVRFV